MLFFRLLLFFGLLASVISNAPQEHVNVIRADYIAPNQNRSTQFFAEDEPISNSHRHERRWGGFPPGPAYDDVWNAAKCKGRKFMAQMSYSDFDAGQALPVPANTVQSPWRYNDLLPWGYYFSGVTEEYSNLEPGGYWGVANLFRHMGISDRCEQDGGQWYAGSFTHYKPGPPGFEPVPAKQLQTYVDPNGVTRRASGAMFYMAVNPFANAIIVQNVMGPKAAADKLYYGSFDDSELPAVSKLSDMMWGLYEYYARDPNDWKKIDFFMHLAITNARTMSIMKRALDEVGQTLSVQPFMFEPGSDGFLAILGSPNGVSIAHFLIQRKAYIGLKTVAGIYVLQCESRSGAACLLFKTQALAQPVPRPQEQGQPGQPGPPGTDPNAPIGGPARKRAEPKRESLRVHTFKLDASGKVAVSSEYL